MVICSRLLIFKRLKAFVFYPLNQAFQVSKLYSEQHKSACPNFTASYYHNAAWTFFVRLIYCSASLSRRLKSSQNYNWSFLKNTWIWHFRDCYFTNCYYQKFRPSCCLPNQAFKVSLTVFDFKIAFKYLLPVLFFDI